LENSLFEIGYGYGHGYLEWLWPNFALLYPATLMTICPSFLNEKRLGVENEEISI